MDTFQMKALDVPPFGDDFDPNKEPQNGEEFLMKVIYERRRCPAVVVCNVAKKQKKNSPIEDEQTVDENVDENPFRQTKEWKLIQIQRFTAVRNKISDLRQRINEIYSDNDDELMVPIKDGETACKVFCFNNKPLLKTVLKINQKDIEQLLEYQVQWLRECVETEMLDLSTTESWLGSWIYSTMVCLIIPLEPSVYSLLRDIAKTCIHNRQHLNDENSKFNTPYNLFITIISTYFGQLDMAEYV